MAPLADESPGLSGNFVNDRLRRVHRLSRLLDDWLRIPGTRYRIGLDGLIGLIPGLGDVIGTLLSAYILFEAIQLGAPATLLLRMAGNIALETLVGAIPILGDIFDIAWKANRKNADLLDAYLRSSSGSRRFP
jgi:Domain of unknown function (DUF4112)